MEPDWQLAMMRTSALMSVSAHAHRGGGCFLGLLCGRIHHGVPVVVFGSDGEVSSGTCGPFAALWRYHATSSSMPVFMMRQEKVKWRSWGVLVRTYAKPTSP